MECVFVPDGGPVRLWSLQLLKGTSIFPFIDNRWHEVRVYVSAGLVSSQEEDCLYNKNKLSGSRGALSRDCDWNYNQEMYGLNLGMVTEFSTEIYRCFSQSLQEKWRDNLSNLATATSDHIFSNILFKFLLNNLKFDIMQSELLTASVNEQQIK